MNKVVIASVRKSVGKTGAIIGISAALNKKIAYLKPFGERMVYQENRLWDYDTALVREIFGLREDPGICLLGPNPPNCGMYMMKKGPNKNLAGDRPYL